ncbi:membrane protein ORF126 [Cyprinid herpesvirus 3]|uniref:ORF126R n=1 Tax=Cyprinid herpesvirus 3 TaxID=180230 RepID=A4FTM0_CYHV3|nr:ORF126R [Cyprinid herpesvirus 3]AOO32530.1 membrane protein ORF126 [Cyprinid herpesvirus 3]AOO32686.1 membrane protein ORF126 [Cyprinid herpesvirus 3]AOO32843.1 membrane protein ORF126 [Cyprinid herpesvirus 3]AOO33000.1 membrane protein ORF126 [Cyprinid herpesvirus 3]
MMRILLLLAAAAMISVSVAERLIHAIDGDLKPYGKGPRIKQIDVDESTLVNMKGRKTIEEPEIRKVCCDAFEFNSVKCDRLRFFMSIGNGITEFDPADALEPDELIVYMSAVPPADILRYRGKEDDGDHGNSAADEAAYQTKRQLLIDVAFIACVGIAGFAIMSMFCITKVKSDSFPTVPSIGGGPQSSNNNNKGYELLAGTGDTVVHMDSRGRHRNIVNLCGRMTVLINSRVEEDVEDEPVSHDTHDHGTHHPDLEAPPLPDKKPLVDLITA